MLPLGSAIVHIMDPPMTRAAALVYRTREGIGWIEPGYWDEDPNGSPQWHEFAGQVIDTDNGVMLQSANQQILVLDAERVRGTDMDSPEVQADLSALVARLTEMHTTLAEQRLLLASRVGAIG